MAGLGGFIGYSMGAVDWDSTIIGIYEVFLYIATCGYINTNLSHFSRSKIRWPYKNGVHLGYFYIHLLRYANNYKLSRNSFMGYFGLCIWQTSKRKPH